MFEKNIIKHDIILLSVLRELQIKNKIKEVKINDNNKIGFQAINN